MSTTRRGFLRRALATVGAALFGPPIDTHQLYQNEAYQRAVRQAELARIERERGWHLPPPRVDQRVLEVGSGVERKGVVREPGCDGETCQDCYFFCDELGKRREERNVCPYCGSYKSVQFETCRSCGSRS